MKWTILSIGLSLFTSGILQAQAPTAQSGPAAMLGAPRASLGIPQPKREAVSPIRPINHAETEAPLLPTGPSIIGQEPLPLPKQTTPEVIKTSPNVVVPNTQTIVNADEPLIQLPSAAEPFVRGDRWRLSAEYLMWWTKGYSTLPLVTSGIVPADTTLAGVLGVPGTTVLFGNQPAASTFSPGFRTGFEWWFGACRNWAFDGHYFSLGTSGESFNFASDGSTLLARPFFNVNDGVNSAEIVAFPGLIAGAINVSTSTSLWGADINLRRKLREGPQSYLDGLIGYRFLSLKESLTITERSALLVPDPAAAVVAGTAFDRFSTSNQFNGAQIGAAMGFQRGRWSFDLRTMIGVGVTSSTVDISGAQTVVSGPGAVSTVPGGLLALDSNSGRFTRNDFAIVPEVTFNIGYDINEHWRVFVGYNLIYWSSVLRPGDQIDSGLDINRIPNFTRSPNVVVPPRPTVPVSDRDFWAQGVNLGLMLKW